MPAPRLPWFKFWIGATGHAKVRTLNDGLFRTWVEMMDAAAQQGHRGRFDSRKQAAALTRRPPAHITALVAAHLVDDTPDGLVMHDWDWWQRWRKEDGNDSAPDPESPPDERLNGHANDTGTTRERPREQHANGHGYDTSSLRVEEETRDVRRKTKEKTEYVETSAEVLSAHADDSDLEHDLFEYYRLKIQPKARRFPRKRIAARLKRFTPGEIRDGIDHFASRPWWMEHNGGRGADWFFESDARAEQFLLMGPEPPPNVVPIREEECSCEEGKADLAISRNCWPQCAVHGDVRKLLGIGA